MYRLHEPKTRRPAIARMHIDMLAPQTFRTMVGIAVARHIRATLLTDKIFYGTLKSFCLHAYCTRTDVELCTIADVPCAVHDKENTSVPAVTVGTICAPSLPRAMSAVLFSNT